MIQSPCNKICTLNSNNVCIGCGRSREEIGSWSQLSDPQKAEVVRKAKARLASISGATATAKEKA